MAKTGSTPDPMRAFNALFLTEQKALLLRNATSPAKAVDRTQAALLENLKAVAASCDLNHLLAAERKFLENELERHADSKPAKGSLEEALEGLSVTEQLVVKIRDPDEYRRVNEAYARPRTSRIGGVPRDEARQFFSSHAARLVNLDKARMTPSERAVVNQRKINIRTAEKIYIGMQEQALGLPAKSTGQDLGMGL